MAQIMNQRDLETRTLQFISVIAQRVTELSDLMTDRFDDSASVIKCVRFEVQSIPEPSTLWFFWF